MAAVPANGHLWIATKNNILIATQGQCVLHHPRAMCFSFSENEKHLRTPGCILAARVAVPCVCFQVFQKHTWKWAWPQNQLAKPAQGVRKTYLAVVHSAPRRRLCSDDGRDNDVRHSAHDWRDLMRDAVRDEERRDNLFAPAAHKRTERRALKC